MKDLTNYQSEKFYTQAFYDRAEVYYKKNPSNSIHIGNVRLEDKRYEGEADTFMLFDAEDTGLSKTTSSIQQACKKLLDNYMAKA